MLRSSARRSGSGVGNSDIGRDEPPWFGGLLRGRGRFFDMGVARVLYGGLLDMTKPLCDRAASRQDPPRISLPSPAIIGKPVLEDRMEGCDAARLTCHAMGINIRLVWGVRA